MEVIKLSTYIREPLVKEHKHTFRERTEPVSPHDKYIVVDRGDVDCGDDAILHGIMTPEQIKEINPWQSYSLVLITLDGTKMYNTDYKEIKENQ